MSVTVTGFPHGKEMVTAEVRHYTPEMGYKECVLCIKIGEHDAILLHNMTRERMLKLRNDIDKAVDDLEDKRSLSLDAALSDGRHEEAPKAAGMQFSVG